MAIAWRDALSVGNDLIDADHRHLISLINKTEELLSPDQSAADLRQVIDQLWKYTQYHFAREENIMIGMRYARYDQHKKEHSQLIEMLRLCTQPIMELGDLLPAKTDKLPKAFLDSLKALLRHWLVDHILKTDMQLKPLLAGRPKDYAP